MAAATACAAAAQGHRTLLLSAEPAVRLDALLGTAADAAASHGTAAGAQQTDTAARSGRRAPVTVPTVPGLWLLRVDAGEEFRTQAVALQERGKAALDLLGAAPLDEDELTELPGAGTFALLRALRTAHGVDGGSPAGRAGSPETAEPAGTVGPAANAEGSALDSAANAGVEDSSDGEGEEGVWDIVVVDMPPTPDGLNLLALPEQLRRYLRRLVPAERQAARALRPMLAQLAGVPMPEQWLYDATARWAEELAEVQRTVEAPTTAVRLVTEPGPLAAEALRTSGAGLRLHGLELESVVANRVLPTGSSDSWLSSLSGQQQAALKELREKCESESVPLCELPHLGRDPRGPKDLASLAGAARTAVTSGDADGARREDVHTGRQAGPGTEVAQGWVEDRLTEDGRFVWHLPLPGATRDELELVRRGDELTVGVGPYRRVLALPSALRRCRVSGAGLHDGALRVRFTPDPALWPGSGGTATGPADGTFPGTDGQSADGQDTDTQGTDGQGATGGTAAGRPDSGRRG